MFSKLNQEFASHQKGFQILLGLVIIVPFVLMIPGVDPFGGGVEPKPSTVGKIAGEDISWDEYEKEAKGVLILQAIYGQGPPRNYSDLLMDKGFQGQVLSYMADNKIVKTQIENGTIKDEVSPEEYKEFANRIESYMMAMRRTGYKFSQQIEFIRQRMRVGGAEVDEIIKFAILRTKLEDALKEKITISDEDLTAEVKKQERTYKIRQGNYSSFDFRDEPLKEYYEKNKENYFRKEAVKASVVQIDYSKFEAAYAKLNVKPELDKFISDELKTVDAKDPKVVEAAKKAATDKFKENKLRELARQKAEQIKAGFERSVKDAKGSSKFPETIKNIAKASEFNVQESVYVDPSDVKEGKFFMNDKALSDKILSLSVEKPVVLHEAFRSIYVVVFNDKGAHAEFSSVRNEILKAVYDADSNNYYLTNKEEFKVPRNMRIGIAEFTSSMFVAETKVTDEQIKAEYDKNASYKQAQRKLIQFALDVDAKATDEDKEKLEEKLKAFADTNKGKQPNDIENIIIKEEEGIKKTTLDWQAQNSLSVGTNKKIMDAAFSAEVGQFTEVLKEGSKYALIFVAAKRDNTPYEEVKGELKSKLEFSNSNTIARKKAEEFHQMLKSVGPKTVESINKAIEEYQKSNPLNVRFLENIMEIAPEQLRSPQVGQFISRQYQVSPEFYYNISKLSEKRIFTGVRSLPPARQKAVGFIKEIVAEHYEDFAKEETKERIYNKLNDNKAEELAKAHTVKVKVELDKNVEDKEKLKGLFAEYKLKEATEVKFKDASPDVKSILKDSPEAGFVGSESQQGFSNLVVYVESAKEVSDEDLEKLKEDHEKRLKDEKGAEKVKKFWEDERKKFTVEVPQTGTVES